MPDPSNRATSSRCARRSAPSGILVPRSPQLVAATLPTRTAQRCATHRHAFERCWFPWASSASCRRPARLCRRHACEHAASIARRASAGFDGGMRVRLVRGPRWAAAATCFLLFAVGCLAGCDAGRAASDPTNMSRPTIGRVDTTVRVLQMNLCNSGRADCYSGGRAVSMAVALIHEHQPDMVSLNEVCRDDLRVLKQAMSATVPAAAVASAFTSAKDRQTQAPVRCQNGQEFGDGVLVVVSPPAVGSRSYSGVYPVQDPQDSEKRVWVCIDLATRFSACTTHTTSVNATIALEPVPVPAELSGADDQPPQRWRPDHPRRRSQPRGSRFTQPTVMLAQRLPAHRRRRSSERGGEPGYRGAIALRHRHAGHH